MAADYLFVYGTLRRGIGHELHGLLASHGRFVGLASCQGRLYQVNHYPALVPTVTREERITGELYRLSDAEKVLKVLDGYEGFFPDAKRRSLFVREMISVKPDNGRAVKAWVYRYNRPVHNLPVIRSGDYLAN